MNTEKRDKIVFDEQVGGDHYQRMRIQPIDYIMMNRLPFAEGNVIKYISRHRVKNGAEDIKKAIQYCLFILDHEYGISANTYSPSINDTE